MKIKTERYKKIEEEIELPITLNKGTTYLHFIKGGGYNAIGKFVVYKPYPKADYLQISYIYYDISARKIIRSDATLADLFEFTHKFSIANDNKSIQTFDGMDYERVEMFNYIFGLDYRNVRETTEESFNQSITNFLKIEDD